MINGKSLKVRQICLFILAFIPVTKFFMMPSIASHIAGQDLWIGALINLSADLLTVYLILKLTENSDGDFFTLTEKCLGKIASRIIWILYIFFFLFKGLLPVTEQKDYIELSLYINTPNVTYFFPFIFLAFYLSLKRLRVIGRISDVLWISTVFGFIMLSFLSVKNLEPERLLPVGVSGIKKIANSSLATLNWYGDGVYFLFFIGEFKKEKNYTFKIISTYFISAVAVLIFTAGFYATFSSIAFRQRFALTEISKYSTVINNVERFDFLGIFGILLSTAFSLSLPIYFATRIAFKLVDVTKLRPVISAVVSGIFILTVFIFNKRAYSLETFCTQKAEFIFLLFGNILPVLLSLVFSIYARIKQDEKNVIKGEKNENLEN